MLRWFPAGSHQTEAGLPDSGGERADPAAGHWDAAAGDPLRWTESGSDPRPGRGRKGWCRQPRGGQQLSQRGFPGQRSRYASLYFPHDAKIGDKLLLLWCLPQDCWLKCDVYSFYGNRWFKRKKKNCPLLRSAACSARGVLQRAGLDWAGSSCGVQPHHHLPGGIWWGIPVGHFHHKSSSWTSTDIRWAITSQKKLQVSQEEERRGGGLPPMHMLTQQSSEELEKTARTLQLHQKYKHRWCSPQVSNKFSQHSWNCRSTKSCWPTVIMHFVLKALLR